MALCDFDMRRLRRTLTYLLTYLLMTYELDIRHAGSPYPVDTISQLLSLFMHHYTFGLYSTGLPSCPAFLDAGPNEAPKGTLEDNWNRFLQAGVFSAVQPVS